MSARAFSMLIVIALTGCAERGAPAPPREPVVCERLGDRCQLPDGPIGICSETTEPCEAPPCLACMSQH